MSHSAYKIPVCRRNAAFIFCKNAHVAAQTRPASRRADNRSRFNKDFQNLYSVTRIEEYRKYLYSFKNLIGTVDGYSFFNDYYIQKMNELDEKYEAIVNNKSLTTINRTKLSIFFESIKKLFGLNASEYEVNHK